MYKCVRSPYKFNAGAPVLEDGFLSGDLLLLDELVHLPQVPGNLLAVD